MGVAPDHGIAPNTFCEIYVPWEWDHLQEFLPLAFPVRGQGSSNTRLPMSWSRAVFGTATNKRR